MYDRFEEWLDYTLNETIPEEVIAFCFNLYEEENNFWTVELVGTSSFDEANSDWACEEVFDSREYQLRWQEESDWESIHDMIESFIRQYLVTGRYADFLKEYQAVGMGFVDGDLTIVYQSEKPLVSVQCPECGKEIPKGTIRAEQVGSLFNNATLTWYPDKVKEKKHQTKPLPLHLKGTGYYCDECMKVFAIFEEK